MKLFADVYLYSVKKASAARRAAGDQYLMRFCPRHTLF